MGTSSTVLDEPSTPLPKSTRALKTLIVNNLSSSIDKSQVIDFFKQAGDVVDVCPYYDNDGKFRRSGGIGFATEEAAKKALKFDRQKWFGRCVKLYLQDEGGTGRTTSKTLFAKNLPFYIVKSDVIKFFKLAGDIVDVQFSKSSGSGHIEFSSEEAAKMAVKLNGEALLGCRIELRRQAEVTLGASQTVCVKNLPFPINKSDVIDFFSEAGDIADVRFSYNEDGTFGGVGHVEFTNDVAATEAAKLNGKRLLGEHVRIGIVREILYIRGLDTSCSDVNEIQSSLRKHFKDCGYIVSMKLLEGNLSGALLGTALIEFSNLQAFHKALALNGQKLDDSTLTIVDSVPIRLADNAKGTGPRQRYAKGRLGCYSGTGYEHRYRSGRGYDGAGIGKRGGPYQIPTGKRIKFDDY